MSLSNTAALAARITGYGIDTPPEPGPSLAIYDQVFLPSKSDGKEAILSCLPRSVLSIRRSLSVFFQGDTIAKQAAMPQTETKA